ncbi:MAG: hypothetical protein MK291_00690 [Planctomycetes bacterium]|nr:hypothetical protein [Planctomycetota bacterium]
MRFFRILAADVAGLEEQAECLDGDQVQAEFDREGRRRVIEGLESLLRHHLRWHLEGRSFLHIEAPNLPVSDAWRRVTEELEGVALPSPGEPCLSIVGRLLGALEDHSGLSHAMTSLWRARWVYALRGPVAGEEALRRTLERLPSGTSQLDGVDLVRRRAVEGVAEALLDRGSARLAGAWLSEHAELVRRGARLRRLAVWTRLVCGEVAGARRAQAHLAPWRGRLPDALVELRERRPSALSLLSGMSGGERSGESWPPLQADELIHRGDQGAIAMVLFRLEPGRGAHPHRVEVAPTLCGDLDAWLAERAMTPFDQGSSEQELLATAAPVISHREEGRALRGAIGTQRSMALSLEPLFDGLGEVTGWLYLEFEHHLVPSMERRSSLARAAERELERARELCVGHAQEMTQRVEDGPLARSFEELVQRTGMKLARRRWWGLERDGEELVLVAGGGEGLPAPLDNHRGQALVLRRALAAGGPVSYDEPDPKLSLHPAAGSGIAVPLGPRGEAFGLLLVESSRRKDFSGGVGERVVKTAKEWGSAVHIAQMVRWYEERFGTELHLPVRSADFRSFAERVARVGRSSEVAVISGPSGAGKSALARWLHYESGAREGRVHVMPGSLVEPDGLRARLMGDADHTLLLEGVEELSAAAQVTLASHLEERGGAGPRGPRLIVTALRPLAEVAEEGVLRRDLVGRLDRLNLFVPPLSDRREEIEELARHLLKRNAGGGRSPMLDEEALALLWRQPWAGGVRELENFLCKLSNESMDLDLIDADFVSRVASESRFELRPRLPSRHPRRVDLLAALVTTQTQGGRANKTGAARCLGWDPDTLVARMRELHIEEEGFAELHRPWTSSGP